MSNHYYNVKIAHRSYRSSDPLTYEHDEKLPLGCLVVVPLRKQRVIGVIVEEVAKPKNISTSAVDTLINPTPVPNWYLPLVHWIANYYPTDESVTLAAMLPSAIATRSRGNTSSNPTIAQHISSDRQTLALTGDQQMAAQAIINGTPSSFLLHGITGSGKTAVYARCIRETLKNDRSAIVLTPEIGLTPQLEQQLTYEFGKQLIVTHSGLTAAKRRDIWLKALSADEPLVVIGPRSALFLPLQSIGLIIIDEAHDLSYKQDQAPYHDAKRVAAQLARLQNAKLVLGSATPSVVDFYTFRTKDLPIISLSNLAITQRAPKRNVQFVDTGNRSDFARSPWLSDSLIKTIGVSLQNGLQSLLYLNRRGTARLAMCQDCTWQAECTSCEMPLTYHGDSHQLICHLCGNRENMITQCPECASSNISTRSAGTKLIVSEVERLFPGTSLCRLDSDNPELPTLYNDLRSGRVQIIIGTQMIGKGLDLPKLATLGIINADSALALPDYIAEEETYQQLSQVVGRVGRGHTAGRVIVQSRQPEHPILQAAVNGDYQQFYDYELEQRKKYGFPPYSHLLKVTVSRKSSRSASAAAEKTAIFITTKLPNAHVLGPAPAFREKIAGEYRWQLIVSSTQRSKLVALAKQLPIRCTVDIDPSRLL
jgi:primosomal protein N' (replication factor Y) (superfamily II helicase)